MKKNLLYIIQKGLIILGVIILIVTLLLGLIGQVDKIRRLLLGVEEGVSYQGRDLSRYLPKEVEKEVYISAKKLVVYPINASINKETGKINSEVFGRIIDGLATIDKILEADEEEVVEPIFYKIKPY